jgi:hypothetical protein
LTSDTCCRILRDVTAAAASLTARAMTVRAWAFVACWALFVAEPPHAVDFHHFQRWLLGCARCVRWSLAQ